jgi:hypothetical protein
MFSLHRDEETKTALSKPTQTILLQCGDRNSVMINKNEMDFHAQRNSQDECKGQMQRWCSLLCWECVFPLNFGM